MVSAGDRGCGGFWVEDVCQRVRGFCGSETGCVGLFDGSKFGLVD